MAGIDLSRPERGRKGKGLRLGGRKKRLSIRIDMTPMVDVAFLLLIFFMVTTVFRRPLAMEVNMPEPGATVQVPEKKVMTVYIDRDETMYQRIGTEPLAPITWDELAPTFTQRAQEIPQLVILVKIHRDARYERMVDMMDTLEDAQMERFSLVPMQEEDTRLLEETL